MINEDDNWSSDGASFLAPELLATIQLILEQTPLILEHRHYRGARSPGRMVFDEYDDLIAYLRGHALPGDNFLAWNYSDLCRHDNYIAPGKWPDAAGRVPRGGAY